MLEKIKKEYESCNKCSNCINNKKVFGCGNPNAEIMIVGDGPGKADSESGVPFSGPDGELLNKMLSAIGLKREELFFTNTIACLTNEKDRLPSFEETQNCAKRLNSEIIAVKPNIILMIGSISLKHFFGRQSKVAESHGHWFMDLNPPYARYFSLYAPTWVLHATTPGELLSKKRIIWEDLKKFSSELEVANFKIKEDK